MSSSYSSLSKAHHILQAMLNVASTESFEVVRDQFFRVYLQKNFADGPILRAQLQERLAQESESAPKKIAKEKTPPPDAWRLAATQFARQLPQICKGYASAGLLQTKYVDDIEQALKKPGTPYERVGNVLAWFKEWRVAQRKEFGSFKKNRYDTAHHKLQSAMTDLVLEVAYAMIKEEKHAPVHALHALRNQPNGSVITKPVEKLTLPNTYYNYTFYPKTHCPADDTQRAAWLARSQHYKEQLSNASPWVIAMDWSWKSNMCFREGSTVESKSVPPIYTLGRYLLVADADTWNREHFCNALVMEKTMNVQHRAPVSGLDTGLTTTPTLDLQKYETWWKEQERMSAKDWRYIRRSSVLLCNQSYGEKLENIAIGDAVARLRLGGVQEVLSGVLSAEDLDVKALLLDRIQPDLGKQFLTLKQVEDSMGPMPDVILQTLETSLQSKGVRALDEPDFDMGTLFS